MTTRLIRAAGAIAATAAFIALGSLPAAATNPGEGAVLFNPDGSPIGSELVYGALNTPQWVYTSNTTDDDIWGLDSSVPPEPDNESVSAGIPLGFDVDISGVVYDQALVNSNGGVCFISSTNLNAREALDNCSGFYYQPLGVYADPAYNAPSTTDYAAILALGNDLYTPYAVPVDTGGDADPDACTFGAYLGEFDGSFYCSSLFWGTTVYEGKAAFVATWYHDPDYHAEPSEVTEFNTFQVLIVNDGDGNITVVNNFDDVNQEGQDLDVSDNEIPAEDICFADFEAGDTANYDFGGIFGTDFAGTPSKLTLFGPACDSPVFTGDALALRNGGSFPLIANSLASSVAGRYIYRVIDGEPTLIAAAGEGPQLAATGATSTGLIPIGALVLAMGIGLVMLRGRGARAAR